MIDEEIIRRIAEIEGFTIWPGDPFRYSPPPDAGEFQGIYCGHGEAGGSGYGWAYRNWLADWSLLGPLMEKYEVTCLRIRVDGSNLWSCWVSGTDHEPIRKESLPYAILLAIIEAEKPE